MMRVLYPIDLGCELNSKVDSKEFKLPGAPFVEIKVYKFGIAIVDFIFDSSINIDNIEKIKLPNRMLLSTYKKRVEKYLLEAIQPFRAEAFPQRHDGELFYPVSIVNADGKVSVNDGKASITVEHLDVLKLALAQYWNLISYDVFLNKEVDFAGSLLNRSNFSFNFYKVVKEYHLLFKEGKEFYRDKLSIVNSLYSFTKENPYNTAPEMLEFYKDCREAMGLSELEKSVMTKIDQISSTYSFLGENLSTLLTIFFDTIFLLWLAYGIIDTILLWHLTKLAHG